MATRILIVNGSPDAMVIAEHDGEIVLANAQTERLFGYTGRSCCVSGVGMLVPHVSGAFIHNTGRNSANGLGNIPLFILRKFTSAPSIPVGGVRHKHWDKTSQT